MALSYIGTLPDSMTVANVVTYSVVADSLPVTIIARRATMDELVYDADRGFTDAWRQFSSLTATVDGFQLILGRRAFSAAGSQIFWADGIAGGAADSDGVANVSTVTGATVSDALEGLDTRIDTLEVAPPGSGDVAGPASSVADHIAVFNGTTGKMIKDGGKTVAAAEASAVATAAAYTDSVRGAWLMGLDLDLTVQANQTITTGTPTIAGKTWTAVDISTYSSQFAIVNGTGLQMKGNALNSGMYDTFRTLAHLKIKLVDFCPGIHLKSRIRLTAVLDSAGASAAAEVVQVGLGSWTHHASQASMARLVHGYISSANQRRIDAWRTANSLTDFDQTTIANTSRQMQLQIDNIEDWAGSFLSSPYTIASPVVWNDPKTFVHARRFDFQARVNVSSPPSSGFLSDTTTRPSGTVLTDINEMALFLGLGTGNTANNTSFIARIQAVRIEYTK